MKHSVDIHRPKPELVLTPKGERLFSRVDAAKVKTTEILRKSKIPATAALGVVAATLVLGASYDTLGPKKEIAETSITLDDIPPREGDISIVEEAIEDLGYNPKEIRGVVAEGQTIRSEAEHAGTDAGTITIHESPIFGYKSVDVSFGDESASKN